LNTLNGILNEKYITIYTLGCKVNQYESDAMLEALLSAGCIDSDAEHTADICIINTCSVTNMADRKSRQIIHRLRKQNPGALIVGTGCYVQAAADELLIGGEVDLVIGNNRKKDVVRILSEHLGGGDISDNIIDIGADHDFENLSITSTSEHTRAYVKIQDGCNNFCTYCIIPYVRGRIRSRALPDIVDEVTHLAASGIREIVLTGINVSSYDDASSGNADSTAHSTGHSLIDVITAVAAVPGILRVRLSSLEPRVITEDFLRVAAATPEFCPHFHLSLQSACNRTLKAMNRKYTIEEYADKCSLIRQYFDRPALTTDVIVGFPGETDEDFEETYRNLEALKLYEMHVFKYSRRRGTVADRMPDQIDETVKHSRSERLIVLADRLKAEYEESFRGEALEVLTEEIIHKDIETPDGIKNKSFYRGHTKNYMLIDIPCSAVKEDSVGVNRIVEWTV